MTECPMCGELTDRLYLYGDAWKNNWICLECCQEEEENDDSERYFHEMGQ